MPGVNEASEWLEVLPDWERDEAPSQKGPMTPTPVRSLLASCALLPYPVSIVQIVGSKGKGSVALMMESLLLAHDLRVGAYTSPHLFDRRERIRSQGMPVPESLWSRAASVMQAHAKGPISRFEAETAMALWCFAELGMEIVLLEAGMGGVNDATSAVQAGITVLTSVEREHTAILGQTEEEITHQKIGGIASSGVLVTGPLSPSVAALAKELSSRVQAQHLSTQHALLEWKPHEEGSGCVASWPVGCGLPAHQQVFCLSMLGRHSAQMALVAIRAVQAWCHHQGQIKWKEQALGALASLYSVGRMSWLSTHTGVMLDVAHTPRSVEALLRAFVSHGYGQPDVILFALNKDKQVRPILAQLLQTGASLLFAPNDSPRALGSEGLHAMLSEDERTQVRCVSSIEEGWTRLLQDVPKGGKGVVMGSFRLIAYIVRLAERANAS